MQFVSRCDAIMQARSDRVHHSLSCRRQQPNGATRTLELRRASLGISAAMSWQTSLHAQAMGRFGVVVSELTEAEGHALGLPDRGVFVPTSTGLRPGQAFSLKMSYLNLMAVQSMGSTTLYAECPESSGVSLFDAKPCEASSLWPSPSALDLGRRSSCRQRVCL